MALKIGIVGLPNVGKSTLFQALTKKKVAIANFPFTTIDPNVGVVAVPDDRLDQLVKLIRPERTVPAMIEFVDIAGLVKKAHQGQGLGNQFLSHVYTVDAILFLLRAFMDPNIPAEVENPGEELVILQEELRKKDQEILEKSLTKKQKTFPLPLRLSEKPALIVCNIRGDETALWPKCELAIDCKLELEMSEMTPKELKELGLKPKLNLLIQRAYEILNLITFYTIKGGKEVRALPIKQGTRTPGAGGQVHTDFEEKFIRASVISYNDFLKAGSMTKAKEMGLLRTEGRDYVVKDGDVIEFKI